MVEVVGVRDVVLSLVSSVIAGFGVWLGQRLLHYRRLARKRAFFGVAPGADCLLVSPRHYSSPQPSSVHSRDTAALVVLATVVNECGGQAELVAGEDGLHRVGRVTELCVGGPDANRRAAAHLRSFLPGVRFQPPEEREGADITFAIGPTVYGRSSRPAEAGYAILAKAHLPDRPEHPVFLLAGQRSWTNLATARFLASQHRWLARRYGTSGRFCLVLKVREPEAYGPDFVEVEADVSRDALREVGANPDK